MSTQHPQEPRNTLMQFLQHRRVEMAWAGSELEANQVTGKTALNIAVPGVPGKHLVAIWLEG